MLKQVVVGIDPWLDSARRAGFLQKIEVWHEKMWFLYICDMLAIKVCKLDAMSVLTPWGCKLRSSHVEKTCRCYDSDYQDLVLDRFCCRKIGENIMRNLREDGYIWNIICMWFRDELVLFDNTAN